MKNIRLKRRMSVLILMFVLSICSVSACASEAGKHGAVIRLDDEGYLYYMDYGKDYYGSEVMEAMREVGFIDSGCSAFCTDFILSRNSWIFMTYYTHISFLPMCSQSARQLAGTP